jgi:hypothetical protein
MLLLHLLHVPCMLLLHLLHVPCMLLLLLPLPQLL